MTTPLLQLTGLTVTYAVGDTDVPAVRGVDLTLDPGGTLGIAGESGSGKSTVAMSVLRLLPRTAKITGEILLDGEDVTTMKWGRLRAVRWAGASVVFQGAMHALNPVRKIGEQIAEPIRLHPPSGTTLTDTEVDARVAELLTQVDLPPSRAGAYPHELSGGQKQRVMIAMALACSPRLIIADEPTTALDVIVQAQVLALLSRLVAEQRIGLIMISHDLSVLAATCERIAVMYDGQIVEEGPGAEVMSSPRHDHTRALAAAFPTVGDPVSRFAPATSTPLPPEPADRVTGEPLLAAENLRVSFRDRTGKRIDAVAGVDLTVARDEIVALVGQSGSGKTTLARTLLGLQKPDSGVVRYAGNPVPAGGAGLKAYRRQVQLVLQDPTSALNPSHTVYEAVAEGPRVHRLSDERAVVHRALEAAELRPAEKYADRLPHQLSGGQRQRVVIAGALALEPAVVVADEPVASLDASVRGEILGLLLRLRRELGLAALVITHDLGLAWNIADRVAVMYRGELVETGTVEQVLLDPQHEYTKSLLAALPGGTAQRRTVET
ncbi:MULTISPECIES: ABC transporter ATP-binding protein [unclassified Amycolatopsis]|uniref:ABC transporter ATP-binding protein n=1 Tax=unclassified Amycolatopsis TaxID=2618356 RepID=UPI002875E582|nr:MULTISPECIES: ABC transporter ATP-binding protein [unclassified Amycolatopsis]MDS0136708.1 ABC transporter ATP-binding protein [Amycolatopsis sp. 505]MDS0143373.1 ABC transporter ATP-binding protein [Amycolatopsis sp. CM201R]